MITVPPSDYKRESTPSDPDSRICKRTFEGGFKISPGTQLTIVFSDKRPDLWSERPILGFELPAYRKTGHDRYRGAVVRMSARTSAWVDTSRARASPRAAAPSPGHGYGPLHSTPCDFAANTFFDAN